MPLKRLLLPAIILILFSCDNDNEGESSSSFKVTVDGQANIYYIDDRSHELVKRMSFVNGAFAADDFNFNPETNRLYLPRARSGNPSFLRVDVLDLLNDESTVYDGETLPFPLPINYSAEALLIDRSETIHAFVIDTSPNGNEVFYQQSIANQMVSERDLTQEFGIPQRGIASAYYLAELNQIVVIWYEGRLYRTPTRGLLIDIDSDTIEMIDLPDIDIVKVIEINAEKFILGGENVLTGSGTLSLYDLSGQLVCSPPDIRVQPTFSSAAISYDQRDNQLEFIERENDTYRTGSLQATDCEAGRNGNFYTDSSTFFINLAFFSR